MRDIESEIEAAWRAHENAHVSRGPELSPELRDRLAEAQNWRCCYCGCKMEGRFPAPHAPTFEHVIPVKLGGATVPENMVVACAACNSGRRHTMRAEHTAAVLSLSPAERRRLLRAEHLAALTATRGARK